MNRRRFLKSASLISLTPVVPTFLGRSLFASEKEETKDGRILVVIQLDGGNDGLNTVIPFKDENYAKLRPKIHVREDQVLKLSDESGLHPFMRGAKELFDDGRLSIVHGVGYPNPNRSHFESMDIWHTASTDPEMRSLGNGWLGDAMSLRPLMRGTHACHIGDGELPKALLGRRCTATSINGTEDLKLTLGDLENPRSTTAAKHSLNDFITRSVSDAYVSAKELADTTKLDSSVRYPGGLGERLKLISQTIKSGAKAQVYYTSQDGYDTHAAQQNVHSNLLGNLSGSLKAFMDDMKQSRIEDRISVVVFSEFGRRVRENSSLGTDHGTAGPVFLLGNRLTNQEFGKVPSLADLDGGDLKHEIDFREVYASVLTDELGIRKPKLLEPFGKTKFFKA